MFARLLHGSRNLRIGRVRDYFLFDPSALPIHATTPLHSIIEVVPRPATKNGFTVLPKRWIVERAFG
jgi:hypothetical protein